MTVYQQYSPADEALSIADILNNKERPQSNRHLMSEFCGLFIFYEKEGNHMAGLFKGWGERIRKWKAAIHLLESAQYDLECTPLSGTATVMSGTLFLCI